MALDCSLFSLWFMLFILFHYVWCNSQSFAGQALSRISMRGLLLWKPMFEGFVFKFNGILAVSSCLLYCFSPFPFLCFSYLLAFHGFFSSCFFPAFFAFPAFLLFLLFLFFLLDCFSFFLLFSASLFFFGFCFSFLACAFLPFGFFAFAFLPHYVIASPLSCLFCGCAFWLFPASLLFFCFASPLLCFLCFFAFLASLLLPGFCCFVGSKRYSVSTV